MYHCDFVHLHVHTQYSLLDGACRIKELVKKAAEFRMPALGMTDHGNMFGAVNFYQAAIAQGVKPIIGCETYVAPESRFIKGTGQSKAGTSHLVLFAKDEEGYRNLIKLVTAGYLEGFYYRPRIDKELLAKHAKGLLATSACLRGEIAWSLRHDDYQKTRQFADEYLQIFGPGNFYLELMENNLPEQKVVNQGLLKLARDLNIPLVATNDVHYLEHSQSSAHEALLCIQTQTTLSDVNRMRLKSEEFYFKDPDLMKSTFSYAPQAIRNTLEISEKCNLELTFDEYHLPHYTAPIGKSKEEYLEDLCADGLKTRYAVVSEEVRQRLQHELSVIKKMDFVSYFLIVWDFIHYAKQNGIPVGPGRGSAAGSLVSYLLGITDLDPLKYGLLFERFLNPERSGMPDIDIDFCYERRQEVIEYVTNKYGKENVAQIITFGTMQARAALRDVGRVMGLGYSEVDKIAKLVPADPGITLLDALSIEPQLEKIYKEDPKAKELIDTARVLEGLNRHASTHAAGVVISDKPLTEYVPLFKTSDDQITTGFAMDDIAKIGLLKMDFLGLRTLTVISEAQKLISQTRKINLDISRISLEDEATYQLLSSGNSYGIFQLESSGMRDLLKKIKPSNFEDVIAILALYRPGPIGSGMVDDFIKRKRGEIEVKYDHPKLQPVLKDTYGIIIYQEQVMRMASVLAGFSMTQADHLRRAMSKKKPEVMEKMRQQFVEGCHRENHIPEKLANKLFDLIDYFSGYGFNRSHSAAYALISYQTAYLKAHYPVEFMCALLTSEKDNTDKVVEYVREAEAMGITVLPAHINSSVAAFSVVDANTIRYGLIAVKNVGAGAIESIIAGRRDSLYTSIFDFCRRVELRQVNRKVLESLIKCGACDGLGAQRSQMAAVLEVAMETAARAQKERESGQISFFESSSASQGNPFETKQEYPDIKEWPESQILAFEKELLGLYISGHPLSRYTVEVKEFTDYSTKELPKVVEGKEVTLVALLAHVKLTTTKKTSERMAIIRLEDLEGEVEGVIFPSVYTTVVEHLKEGLVVVVKGRVAFREDAVTLMVNDIKKIETAYGAVQSIHIDLTGLSKEGLIKLQSKLRAYPGKVPIYLSINTKTHKGVQILVGEDYFVDSNETLIEEIKELVGVGKFSLTL